MREIDSIHVQLEAAARAVEARSTRVHDALHALADLTRAARASAGPIDAAAVERWITDDELVPDETGFFERRSLLARLRAGEEAPDEVTLFWPAARKDELDAARRLHPLRNVGPVLRGLMERIGELAWIYYQDVANVAIVYPPLDMVTAVPPEFDWRTYHSFASVTREASPDRGVRWTPPNVDYGGKGLISCVSIPIDEDDELTGVWSIDITVRSLLQGVALGGLAARADGVTTFIAERDGHLVAHPSIEALSANEKGSVHRERISKMGGGFATLDVASLYETGAGQREIVDANGDEHILCHRAVRGLPWVVMATYPVHALVGAITRSFAAAFERIRHGDLSFRMGEAPSEAMRDLVDAFDRMAAKLEHEQRERDVAQQERQKLAEQLAHAQKMQAIGQLAGGVAHDFNNLLTAVLAGAHYLVSRETEPKKRELAHVILEAAERATALTGQLLAFSRQHVRRAQPHDPASVLERVRPLLARVAGEEVALALSAEDDHGLVRIDESELVQVALNLVVNARDAMPRGGRLVVETRRGESSRELVLRFRDEGEGMSEDVRARMFEPLFTTKRGGTGLGLTTVRSIVEEAGGRIEVRSAPGAGATIDVILPRLGGDERAAARISVVPAGGGRETVLVVDDERLVQRAAEACLREHGYEVLSASSADEALSILAQRGERVALVITDLAMPGVSGHELAALVRERWPRVRMLSVSGYAGRAAQRTQGARDDASGAHELPFLAKPFTPDALATKVREVLDE